MKTFSRHVRAAGLLLGVAFSLLGVAFVRPAFAVEASEGTVCGWVLPSAPVAATLTNAAGRACADKTPGLMLIIR